MILYLWCVRYCCPVWVRFGWDGAWVRGIFNCHISLGLFLKA
ncbi:hypothetical protein HMPREF1548_05560 [Clostridium sp. KLE 1755]|nr:hypothetical protein HMPREF1548_05560 [Clostridium sp. KLE 1755]